MTETSLVPMAAAAAQLTYDDVVRDIVDAATARRARAAH
jgi:D-alanine-D-alanine ligase-like ATP-grasp enzyme